MLGRHMIAALIGSRSEIRAFVRPTSDLRHLKGQPVELIYGDADDPKSIRRAVAGVDWIFHLAGYLSVDSPFGAPAPSPEYKKVNVGFTEALLKAGLEAGIGRFIFASSNSVYDIEAAVPTPESSPLRPVSDYGHSKAEAENRIMTYQGEGLATTIVRPSVVYGQGDRYFTPTALRLSRLPYITLVNGGRSLFDLVYAGEVARLMMMACQTDSSIGRVYNAGSGVPTSLSELISAFRRLTGRGPRIIPISSRTASRFSGLFGPLIGQIAPGADAAFTPAGIALMSRDFYLDMSRARSELGYEPQIDLDQGLALTLKDSSEK